MPGPQPALLGGTADGTCCSHQWPNCKHHPASRSPAFCFLRVPFSLLSCSSCFVFLVQTAILYPVIPFKSWLKMLCSKAAFCPQRRMSRGVNPSLVSWLTTMMGLRLQVVLEHMPVGPDAILRYVRRVGDPPQVRALMGYGVGGLEGTGEA